MLEPKNLPLMLNKQFAGTAHSHVTASRSVIAGLRATVYLLVGTLALLCASQSFATSTPAKIKVLSEASGGLTRIMVENKESTDMTATIEIKAVNMECSVPLPHTVTVPAGKTVPAFTLTPKNVHGDWSYNWVNHYTVGRADARHDSNYLYTLPYMPGASFKVSQGYHGTFSHTGPDEYALDFKMPEGTPVLAAREGTVVSVKDNSERGGPSRKYEDDANLIVVQHSDGTMAHYCHLQGKSGKVRVGEKVRAGDMLALSGNTGFTSGPHLHFAVFKAKSGFGRETIPVKFRTADAAGITLVGGKSYKAADAAPLASN
ncbi:MAG TPA: M23 family metallopeptidase [Candidatus Acidoferrum sp.]|nr:M23 family metallopeptidase [Candidatus Acidoferrum sp.]